MLKRTRSSMILGGVCAVALLCLNGCSNDDAASNPPPAPAVKSTTTVPQNIPEDQKAAVAASIAYGNAKQAEANAQGNAMMAGQQKAAQAGK